jgi:hypothetical protein
MGGAPGPLRHVSMSGGGMGGEHGAWRSLPNKRLVGGRDGAALFAAGLGFGSHGVLARSVRCQNGGEGGGW